ncbi:hypothetical protein [Stenotrophomonas maltophilia]|uniref:hypothetical protein n=1 Tax=Stenotrophomonas maltophilia TaxID=40324 RepID=UPI00050A2068|nr:hypothetical protein [Stenotrophomonas maltophilia]KGM25262.1 hypothetical protein LI87_0102300 [Stenotrophomonas maltophilia]
MDAIEQRAREWLADGLRSKFPDDIATRMVISQLLADELDLINARVAVKVLAAALTPPEGYVLVPVEPTQEMLNAGYGFESGYPVDPFLYRAMLAVRPEVKP